MRCPQCAEVDLLITNRADVEIDYCPKCRGVWLDRGELDKIVERANRERARDHHDDDDDRDRRRGYGSLQDYGQGLDPRSDYRHSKRKSFWTELFD